MNPNTGGPLGTERRVEVAQQSVYYDAEYPSQVVLPVIKNDQEFKVTLEWIQCFQQQVAYLRKVENNPANYRLSVGSYLAELDRMYLTVRDYLWLHPSEVGSTLAPA